VVVVKARGGHHKTRIKKHLAEETCVEIGADKDASGEGKRNLRSEDPKRYKTEETPTDEEIVRWSKK